MKTVLFLFSLVAFSVFMIIYTTKKQNKLKKGVSSNAHKTTAYQVYLNWCKKHEFTPVLKDEFNKLKNENGNIDISDMLALHPEFQAEIELNKQETEAQDKQKEEELKKERQQFGNSAIIGYLTDSTVAGTLFGGNLLGGILGNHLSKKKKKK